MSIRVGIVGCGRISGPHVSALRATPGVEVCGVCDRNLDNANGVATLLGGVAAYQDLQTLLRQERPNAVHILTPPETHAGLAIQAMQAGCHVLVEKPMALSVRESDEMVSAAQAAGVRLCTSHNYLFKPSMLKATRLVQDGAVGEVVRVDSYYGLSGEGASYSGSAGRTHWAGRLPGGPFTNFLPHLVYLQLAFLREVDSVGGVVLSPVGASEFTATEMTVLLQSAGVVGTMTVSMRAKPYAKFVDVYGTRGIVHADLVREVCTIHRERELPRMVSKVVFSLEDVLQLSSGTATSTAQVVLGRMRNMPGLHHLVREFYASIAERGEPPVPGEEGRAMVAVLEKVWSKMEPQSTPTVADTAVAVAIGPQSDAERRAKNLGHPGKVLVTGATGFLGHHLVASLARCGAKVVALVRDREQASLALAEQAELISGDLSDPASVASALRDVSVVYHCAAITANNVAWELHRRTNVQGTGNVLRAALEAGVQRVIHVSSVAVYGLDSTRHNAALDETAPYARCPDRWAHYLRSKLEADALALAHFRDSGLPVTVLRLGLLYGPGSGRSVGRGLVQLGSARLMIGSGRNRLPYTYVDDAVDCLLLAALAPAAIGQAYNVVGDSQVSVRDAARLGCQILGEKLVLVPVPAALLSGVARVLELRNGWAGVTAPPKLSRYVIRSGCRDILYDAGKAKEQLGWRPSVSLAEGLRRTLGHA